MKGIVLAGGTGSRLLPITRGVSKQLLPVFDKPMVYYPLSLLMLAGVRDVLVITTPADAGAFARVLGDGAGWGLTVTYAVQPSPGGIAQALLVGEAFLDGDGCGLVLGDNLLYGQGLRTALRGAAATTSGAHIFGYPVSTPEHYGVLAFDGDRVVDVVEKPARPPSRLAVPGLYFFDGTAPARVRDQRPSARGELEITDLHRSYLRDGQLAVTHLGRGVAWLDMGTPENLLAAAGFVEAIQARQGLLISSPEEIAWRQGWIDDAALAAAAHAHAGTTYGALLGQLVEGAPDGGAGR
ncbi:MAG: glucose-1-phosphate thymidylyltransferase RfbA [Alphaproteobacteria bacterium]|nr:glucose-1-phosphate thymidylyltransferase RfbA [Alphaproteobacteria bacterium]